MKYCFTIPKVTTKAILRKAQAKDIRDVWQIANDPTVRSASFISEPIPWENHRQWYLNKIDNNEVLFLVLEIDGVAKGQIRYEKDNGSAWVNFSIHKNVRGKGLGAIMLETSIQNACSKLHVTKISAAVKHENLASIRCFTKLSFKMQNGHVKNQNCIIFERDATMWPSILNLGTTCVGKEQPVFIIAELSANHGQSLDRAKRIIREAARCGADAIKIQTYTPETMTINKNSEHFLVGKGTIWEGKTLFQLYQEAYTPWEWHAELKNEAERQGLLFFSTPFDNTAVDFLEDIGVNLYKIASFELVDIPLLKKIAKTHKPVIMSTGMASLAEIDEAVTTLHKAGCHSLALLKCTSAYPAPPEEMNLRTIPNLAETFGLPVGLSDHTIGLAAPVASVALGASIIEKHFTFSRSDHSPDSTFSMEPEEFSNMVQAIRETEKSLGRVTYTLTEKEKVSKIYRRSLFVVEDIKGGEPFTPMNVKSIRPSHGLHPRYLPKVLKYSAAFYIPKGTPLNWEMLGTIRN